MKIKKSINVNIHLKQNMQNIQKSYTKNLSYSKLGLGFSSKSYEFSSKSYSLISFKHYLNKRIKRELEKEIERAIKTTSKNSKNSKTEVYLVPGNLFPETITINSPLRRILLNAIILAILTRFKKVLINFYVTKILPKCINFIESKFRIKLRIEIIHSLILLIDKLIASIQLSLIVNSIGIAFYQYFVFKQGKLFDFLPPDIFNEVLMTSSYQNSQQYYNRKILTNPMALFDYLEKRIFQRKRALLANVEFLKANEAILEAKTPKDIIASQYKRFINAYKFLEYPVTLIKSLPPTGEFTIPEVATKAMKHFRSQIYLRLSNDKTLINDLNLINTKLFSDEKDMKNYLPDILTVLMESRLDLQKEFFNGVANSSKIGNVSKETLIIVNTAITAIKKQVK